MTHQPNHHMPPCGCPPMQPVAVGEINYSAEQINQLLALIPLKMDRKELHGLISYTSDNYIGHVPDTTSLKPQKAFAWAFVGELSEASPYFYYTPDFIPEGLEEGWNDMSSFFGKYNMTPSKKEDTISAEKLFAGYFRLPTLTADKAIADEQGNRIIDTYVMREAVANHIKETYNKQFTENPPLITKGYITPEMLSEETRQMLEATGQDITNLPDGEDLQAVHGVLKFANKEYNPNSYDGLGRQYIRRNIVNGVNTLVQSMVQWSNTLYIIRYDHDLQGRTITIPEGCTLMFESGKLYNGKVVFNDTQVRPYGCLLKDYIDCQIEGTFRKGQVLYSEQYKQTEVWTGKKWKCSYSVLFRVNGNKLQQSVDDGETWEDVSDYIASYFRFVPSSGQNSVGKIQISQDNKTWTDLSPEITNHMRIADYVATTAELPKNAPQGLIYGVGPVDGSTYTLYVNTSKGWINNGSFTSFTAGVVQETGDNENVVMSQKAVTEKFNEQEEKLAELGQEVNGFEILNGVKKSFCFPSNNNNIYNGDYYEKYYIDFNTGKIERTSYDFFLSSLIPVFSDNELVFSHKDGSTFKANDGFMFYDKNGTVITYGQFGKVVNPTLSIPKNAAYLRFSAENIDNHVMVEYGIKPSEYVAYEAIPVIPFLYSGLCEAVIENSDKLMVLFKVEDGYENGYFSNDNVFVKHNNYNHTLYIDVQEGDIVTSAQNFDNQYVKGIAFFDKNKQPVQDLQSGSVKISPCDGYVVISYTNDISDVVGNAKKSKNKVIESMLKKQDRKEKTSVISNYSLSIAASSYLSILDVPKTKNWYQLSAYFQIPNGMQRVRLLKGTSKYANGFVDIDSTNIYEYGNESTLISTTPHGIDFNDFVVIKVYKSAVFHKALLTIETNNTELEPYKQEIFWNGSGAIALENKGTNAIEKVRISYGGTSYDRDIWIFGDSYTDMWPQYMYLQGYNNFSLDGETGRGAESALESLNLALRFGTPKQIVWMLGMNNPDNPDSVNSEWYSAYQALQNLCINNGIELILATIPNVPDRIHTFKNAIIKSSGLKYLDIAECVGANEIGSSWFNGLLSSDNVHPYPKGKEVIAEYICACLPKLRQHISIE